MKKALPKQAYEAFNDVPVKGATRVDQEQGTHKRCNGKGKESEVEVAMVEWDTDEEDYAPAPQQHEPPKKRKKMARPGEATSDGPFNPGASVVCACNGTW